MNSTKRTINTNYIDGVLSPRNYITNGKATNANTLGWATYADAAGTSPVDGTGGSPNVTIATSSTSPLSGDNSFTLVKDAANRQGQGWSYDFTIDASDQAKVLQLSIDYLVSSGTFVAGSTTTDSDVTLWFYDVTNGVVIQPSTFRLYSNSSTICTTAISNFQTASNSTSYRLIMHVGSTSASAYTLKVDNVSVAPTQYVYGTPITDWQSYTPTFTGFGTPTSVEFQYRRAGANYEVRGKFISGVSTATEARITLPNSSTIASTATVPSLQIAGYGAKSGVSASDFGIRVPLITAGNTYFTVGRQTSGTAAFSSGNGSDVVSNGDTIQFNLSAPIQGLSSSVQMSDSADTRVTTAKASGDPAASTTANPIIFPTVDFDTHGAYSSVTGKYTVPTAGYYKVSGHMQGGVSNESLALYVNNVNLGRIGSFDSNNKGSFVGSANVRAGDLIHIGALGNVDVNNASLTIEKITGPSAIAATETIAAAYYLGSGTFATTTTTPINFDTKEYDTHGAVTTSPTAWKFTAPASGLYTVSLNIYVRTGSNNGFVIYKNGTAYKFTGYVTTNASVSSSPSVDIRLNAGDYIDIRPTGSISVGNGGASPLASEVQMSIKRVGL